MVIAGGGILELSINFIQQDSLRWVRQTEDILEEGLEMFGAIVFLSGLLAHQQILRRRVSGS